jgi:hypothetical protein
MLKQNVGCECNRNKYEDRCEDACKNFLRALLFLLESNYLLIILNRGVTGEACLSAPLRQHSTTGFEKNCIMQEMTHYGLPGGPTMN